MPYLDSPRSPKSASQTLQQKSLLTLPPQSERERGGGVICKLRGALLGDRSMSRTPPPTHTHTQSGMIRKTSPVHLKDLTKGTKNSIGVWWLPSGGKCWGVHPCPTEQRSPLTTRERSHFHRLLAHSCSSHRSRPARDSPGKSVLPGQQKPGGEGGCLPVRPLGYLPRSQLLRTSSMAYGKRSDCAHPPGTPAQSLVEKVR